MPQEKTATRQRGRWLSPVWIALRLSIALVAIFALRRELAQVNLSAVNNGIAGYGWAPIAAAFACAAASFLLLGVFELFALRYAAGYEGCESAARVPRRTAFLTSFVASAFSQSIGLAVVTGGAVRIRAYSLYGVSAAAVARVSGFVTITATLGLLAAGAVAVFESPVSLSLLGLSYPMHVFGILLSLPVLAYLTWGLVGRRDIGRGSWRMRRPSKRVAISQVTLSVFDWISAGTVLFVLLPPTAAGYLNFLGAYLIAQTVGVVSHVPGGLGVFEGVFLSLVAVTGSQASLVAASLVMYRVVYYLTPLVAGMAIAGIADLRQKQQSVLASRRLESADPGVAHAG